ncbi:MAG: sensor protein KdpD [Prevotella sp.]|jgi:two-component system sensor histidine kinase KdpD|nr:sensor protein KdpD [Prevotella sp.]MCI1686246.1 sensor protein KdpD [Prevotella sp.]MCI1802813.1 sensor protein KdpD [Prevotella sp.]MCI1817413.1 sensor protein KdpD [Prevotella sp.]MCI1848451.1 sensor protein KdpD [Prevotella sp.]
MNNKEDNVRHFLDLIQRSRRGKFKLYIGMIAGVGKTYRMLQDAHDIQNSGIDVQIGYVETHGRQDTERLLKGLPVIPRKRIFYKGKEIEEMDVDSILLIHPELVIVDELAHSNVSGSRNAKRWQDVEELLDAGINVLSAVNIQHIESLKEEIRKITGIDVQERIPDKVIQEADEVVNIDLTSDELISRLKAGKIYTMNKVQTALDHFFRADHILRLRELALKEVALSVENQVANVSSETYGIKGKKILACISSNNGTPRHIIRKAYRLARHNNTSFVALYVQTRKEKPEKIDLASQRHLIHHFELVEELGGKVEKVVSNNITDAIIQICRKYDITNVCMGQPSFKIPNSFWNIIKYRKFLHYLSLNRIDLVIIA